jgi:hypothetical protein
MNYQREVRADGWLADEPGALTPVLKSADSTSDISPEEFRSILTNFLASAPPAWDPYAGR